MNTLDYGSLAYLGLLAAALIFWMFVQNRDRLGKKLQYLAVWGLIFLGAVAAAGLWGDIRQTMMPAQAVFADQGRVELPRAPDGHYYVSLDINGVPTRFVVDTGATGMVLTQKDAERAGLDPEALMFHGEATTANGTVQTAPVRLDEVALGPFTDRGVRAYVNGGEMKTSLLGMSYLQRFHRLEISGGKLVLER
ncbi:TIGR02281 family clan AA aspartic protease [Salipiger sp. P9]|uniref:retropepsin-like aspartic protease family protein n=1 Tax=Salipiger pentaromativorans TaxID=2943193 RepID=UPI0021588CBD|nr:TIGR02281 family clan AA aspartic protease [Salipiger pentaromativorans]MCR8550236.1 TIGR02281 family clan AA aspartic protease [Salipiger pentaromativorans]